MLFWFHVDVSEDVDVGEVDSEPAEQRGHPGWKTRRTNRQHQNLNTERFGRRLGEHVGSRSTIVVDSVNLSTDEDSDPAVAPLAPGGQQIWDQQSQTYKDADECSSESGFVAVVARKQVAGA